MEREERSSWWLGSNYLNVVIIVSVLLEHSSKSIKQQNSIPSNQVKVRTSEKVIRANYRFVNQTGIDCLNNILVQWNSWEMHPKVSVLTLVCMNVFLSRKAGVRLRQTSRTTVLYYQHVIMQPYQDQSLHSPVPITNSLFPLQVCQSWRKCFTKYLML